MVAFVRIVRGRPGDILGGGMFANKTFANGEVPPNVLAKVQWTFANWRSSTECVGEKVQWTFANWRSSTECIGESTVDFRQWRKSYWRKSYWRNSGTPIFSD
ncbi:unnamed protein product [Rotaria socialis]